MLARFPYAGQHVGRRYRLQLGCTQFAIVYSVDEEHERVNILTLVHGRHRRAR